MKKIISIFLLVVGIFALGGCNKEVVTDVSSLSYLDSISKENIAYNLSLAAGEIKSASFKGNIIFKGKQYDFKGKIIVKDSIKDSIVHIEYSNNDLYLKKGNIYLSYMYNNTNVIVKDSVENYTKEVASLLKAKGINCDNEVILDFLEDKNIEDINFDNLSNYVEKIETGFLIKHKNIEAYLNDKYLPETFKYQKGDIGINVEVNYQPVAISVPIGYDLVDIKISTIKNLLKIDNIGELIK